VSAGNPPRAETIDAHHHLWRYTPAEYGWIDEDMQALRRDFLPADLTAAMATAGIDGTIAVQARQTMDETRWLLDLADANEAIRGVVGWAPIAGEEFPGVMEEFDGRAKLKGLRHVIQGERDEHFILREDFNSGIRTLLGSGLVYEILIYERHLPDTIDFVDEHPEQVFVLDHIAKPLIAAGQIEPWATRMKELGQRENVWCKLSGVVTEAEALPRRCRRGLRPRAPVGRLGLARLPRRIRLRAVVGCAAQLLRRLQRDRARRHLRRHRHSGLRTVDFLSIEHPSRVCWVRQFFERRVPCLAIRVSFRVFRGSPV